MVRNTPFSATFRTLSDHTIMAWMDTAAALDKMREPAFRQDSIGMFRV